MKILCPVDFSVASTDALWYAVALTAKYEPRQIELLHCLYPGIRSSVLPANDRFLYERAEQDMNTLLQEVKDIDTGLKLTSKILRGDPLDQVSPYIRSGEFDYVVTGTKGLNAKKDAILGSLTEKLFEKSQAPVIAIPQGYVFQTLHSVVFAVDNETISSGQIVEPLLQLVRSYYSKLTLLHIRENSDDKEEYDPDLDYYLQGIKYDYYSKLSHGSINKAVNEVCLRVEADLLCMIHRDRGWRLNLVHHSQVREELSHISMPILVLHD